MIKNAIVKTFSIFLFLSALSALLIFKSYERDLEGVRTQASETASLQSEKVSIYLADLKIKIELWRKYFSGWEQFSEKSYLEYARYFTLLTPSVLAVNYTEDGVTLSYVYPLEGNEKALGKSLLKHPDDEIRNLAIKGLDRDEVVFTPPVDILQGGKAVIFYAPVKYRNGSSGWLNIVIRIDRLFSEFLRSNLTRLSKTSIVDKATGRYLHKGFEISNEEETVKREIEFEGRTFVFITDIYYNAKLLYEKYLDFTLYIIFILFLLSLSLYFYFKKIDDERGNLVNAKSEKNLLRIMFHDLSNPLSVVQLYALDMEERYKDEPSLPKMLKRIKQMIEIISSIRHLDYLNRDVSKIDKKRIVFKDLFDDLLQINQDLIQLKSLRVTVVNPENLELSLRIPYELLKNEIINNLLNNAIKFATIETEIKIEIFSHKIKITNKSIPINPDILEDLNLIRPTESRAVNHSTKGHGLGFFIAKILSKKFALKLSIEQDLAKSEVYTILRF